MAHYLITGAGGYVGSMLIKEIYQRAERYGQEVQITALVRDKEKAGRILPEAVRFIEADISREQEIEAAMEAVTEALDYIIHCAAATTSGYMISHPAETADGIVLGTRNMLELARRRQIKGMVYLSSMEVYGSVEDIGRTRGEEELGSVSLEAARSCYPLGKRMAEHYCHSYQQEYGVPVKIARLAQTFGSGVRQEDNRVYMQFARSVIEGRDIVLQTQGRSIGNYCAVEDAVNGILTILEKGEAGQVYNVVNEENTMCIREMAELVANRVAEGGIQVKVCLQDAEKTGYAPDTGLRLSGERLRSLGWQPTKNLAEMYRDVIATLEGYKA